MTPRAPQDSSILIVDDAEENLVALKAVLGPLGQEVVAARSGEEALKCMLRQDFAVVLLDVLMPGMDGFETAANIKRLDQTKDVPVILLTGADVDTDYAYRGYALGVADFLAKPIDPWVLRTKVGVFLELHRKNRQLAVQAEQLRRLLTGDGATGGRDGTDAETGSGTEGDDVVAELPPPQTGPGSELHENPDRLAEISVKLVEIGQLLHEGEGFEPRGLAERVSEMEDIVRGLARDEES